MPLLYPKREAALHGKAWSATKRASALHAMPAYQGSARHCTACHCCIPREKLHYTARPGPLPREPLHSMLCPRTKGVRDTALHATAVSQERSCTTRQGLVRYQESLCTPCHARVPRECETLPCMPLLYPKREGALHGKAWSATKRASALHAMTVYQGCARQCTAYRVWAPSNTMLGKRTEKVPTSRPQRNSYRRRGANREQTSRFQNDFSEREEVRNLER
ncbi:hypothetical protein NDU88_006475 [Pleurodeles waltl]|uniref:Uncharacterized protein n=1 Tax=Pleurodeles waltl TaxID=8319 RepID=A0AAV7L3T9_PLEWA|nr:hypothetical protein NDU88_006475 [Pleurodeles waltl]